MYRMQITISKPYSTTAAFINNRETQYAEFLSALRDVPHESSKSLTSESGSDILTLICDVSPENVDAFNKVLADFKLVRNIEVARRESFGITTTVVSDAEIIY